MIHSIDRRTLEVLARLQLRGHAEVRGIHRRPNGGLVGTLAVCGVEIDLTRADAEVLAEATAELLTDLTRAEQQLGDNGTVPRTEETS